MYDVGGRCVLCGQREEVHENFAKCLILLRVHVKNGRLTERGRERARELGVRLLTVDEIASNSQN